MNYSNLSKELIINGYTPTLSDPIKGYFNEEYFSNNKLEFIKLDELEFKKQELDCTELNSIEEIIEKINSINLEENKLYEIILIGKRNFEININEIYKYYLDEKIIKIKNNTKINYNIEKIIQENNLKGLFVKELLNNKNNYNEKIIEKALEIGLEILS